MGKGKQKAKFPKKRREIQKNERRRPPKRRLSGYAFLKGSKIT